MKGSYILYSLGFFGSPSRSFRSAPVIGFDRISILIASCGVFAGNCPTLTRTPVDFRAEKLAGRSLSPKRLSSSIRAIVFPASIALEDSVTYTTIPSSTPRKGSSYGRDGDVIIPYPLSTSNISLNNCCASKSGTTYRYTFIPANGFIASAWARVWGFLANSERKLRGNSAFSRPMFSFTRLATLVSASAARSVAAFAVSASFTLSASSNTVYWPSRIEESASYNHSAPTPKTTKAGNSNDTLDSIITERTTDMLSGYASQYKPKTRTISFLYSPISPTTTTREASAIAYLSADIEDSRTDLSMGNNHKSLDKIADDSAGRMHKLTIILLVVLVIGIYGLVSDIRAKK
jgi:hypothetical protein